MQTVEMSGRKLLSKNQQNLGKRTKVHPRLRWFITLLGLGYNSIWVATLKKKNKQLFPNKENKHDIKVLKMQQTCKCQKYKDVKFHQLTKTAEKTHMQCHSCKIHLRPNGLTYLLKQDSLSWEIRSVERKLYLLYTKKKRRRNQVAPTSKMRCLILRRGRGLFTS